MKLDSRKMFFTKLGVIFALLALIFGVHLFSNKIEKVSASASGPTPAHTGALGEANCAACHGDFPVNSGTGSVTITGVPVNYVPNQQYQLTVRASQAAATIYGFQMTAIDALGRRAGTFVLPSQTPARLQLDEGFVGGNFRQYIEHTADGIIPAQFDYNEWTFTWTAPASRVGKISFHAAGNAANSDGSTGGDYIYTTSKAALTGTSSVNFDSDDKSDFTVWRRTSAVWYSLNSSDLGYSGEQFGLPGDRIAPGDYDGDGKTDKAVWRASESKWFVQKSSGGIDIVEIGQIGDRAAPGDYDGDGKADIAVWRPLTGVWYIRRSSDSQVAAHQWGVPTDKLAQGDYDGDGKTDLGVFRPSSGDWYIWRSSDNAQFAFHFGLDGDKPTQSDYDGDGKTDFAVFRPSTGTWYVFRSSDNLAGQVQFGLNGDQPAPTDYDGDGKTDFAVFREGLWYILRSTDLGVSILRFGLAVDIPVAAGYIAE